MLFLGIFVLCNISLVFGVIDPPIPVLPTPPGIVLGNGSPTAKVKLEVFLELLCSDSRNAYVILKDLAAEYDPNDLQITIHQYTLPYHRNAYVVNQGYNYVLDQFPEAIYEYIDGVFENMARWVASVTREMNDLEVLDDFAAVQEDFTGIPSTTFKNEVGGYASETVYQWKYGVRRGAAGTPWYYVNGVDLGFNPVAAIPYDDLKNYIDSLLAQL